MTYAERYDLLTIRRGRAMVRKLTRQGLPATIREYPGTRPYAEVDYQVGATRFVAYLNCHAENV